MDEKQQLTADLRLQESLYAAAKMRKDYLAAQLAAQEMARLNHLHLLLEQQAKEENE